MSEKTRVYILQEIIPNYRIPVFQRIFRIPGVDLTVFYFNLSKKKIKENFKPADIDKLDTFKHIKLPLLEIGRRSLKLSFIKYLVFRRPNIAIIGPVNSTEIIVFVLICKALGIKILWWSGGVPYDRKEVKEMSKRGSLSRIFIRKSLIRRIYFRVDGMIVYSDFAKWYFESSGFNKPIFVAHNSPDTDSLLKYKHYYIENSVELEELRKSHAAGGEKIILMLGRLNKGRKTGLLIEAFERIAREFPLVRLIIIGDGSERESLENQVKNKNLENKIDFLGAIYDDKIQSKYFMLCDIYVTPGIASLTVKMAMCFGKPVVSTAYGLEIHAIENGKNGFIVDIDDSKSLADKILLLLKNDELRQKMGKRAERTIKEKINITKMIEGFENAIHSFSQ